MKTIGFHGGCDLIELGTINDVKSFFYCINKFVDIEKSSKYKVITNRLYKHYIAIEELDIALSVMDEVRDNFKKIEPAAVDWSQLIGQETRLDIAGSNLAEVYSDYFEKFIQVVEIAKLFNKEFDMYKAVKVVVTDAPEYSSFTRLSLGKYDALIGDPLWLRE